MTNLGRPRNQRVFALGQQRGTYLNPYRYFSNNWEWLSSTAANDLPRRHKFVRWDEKSPGQSPHLTLRGSYDPTRPNGKLALRSDIPSGPTLFNGSCVLTGPGSSIHWIMHIPQ